MVLERSKGNGICDGPKSGTLQTGMARRESLQKGGLRNKLDQVVKVLVKEFDLKATEGF